jgi:hypothetical protein
LPPGGGGGAGAARALCDRASAAQEVAKSIDPDKVYEWDALRCRGEALLALHDAKGAIVPLEKSVTLTRREWPGDLGRARFALARALAESHGDVSRARGLATQARDELASRPGMSAETAGVQAWLAAHAGS